MIQSMKTLTSSKTNDWCTPPHIIRCARETFGGTIDLDPASNAIANKYIVKAKYYFDETDSGITKNWYAESIFLNPPYNKVGNLSSADVWGQYMIDQYQRGNFKTGILLTKTVPGYDWWDNFAWRKQWPGLFCVTYGRLSFIHLSWISPINGTIIIPEKKSNVSKAASTLWYLGADPDAFRGAFANIGHIISNL